jgi:gamma-glutamylputrescine oxidase
VYELPFKASSMAEHEKRKTNRRSFLKSAAATGAATVATNAVFPVLIPEKPVFEANHSHWVSALPVVSAPLEEDIETDVAVIGGGLTGLSAAYYLKKNRPTDRVVLFEAMRCGNGASGRNGAMLLTSTEDRYMIWSGDPALDKRIYDLTVDNALRLLRLSREMNYDAELEINGALQMGNTNELADGCRQFVERAKPVGFPFEFWDREKIAATLGTSAYPGAVFDPCSGQVHPGKLVVLFKSAAQSAATEIYENTPVTAIDEGEFITLTTANGKRARAKSIILATNAYTSKLGYLRRATTPIFDYVAMTSPLSDRRLAEIGWKKRIPFNDSRTEVFYLGLTRDSRIHIGGGPVDYAFNNGLREPLGAETRFEGLRAELGRIFPALVDEPFEITWSGAVDMSLDQTPSVGQIGKYANIFYAIGFSGHGLNLTSVFGRVLADLIHDKSKDWAWLPYVNRLPLYTPNEPFRWTGVKAAVAYYRHTDPKVP